MFQLEEHNQRIGVDSGPCQQRATGATGEACKQLTNTLNKSSAIEALSTTAFCLLKNLLSVQKHNYRLM